MKNLLSFVMFCATILIISSIIYITPVNLSSAAEVICPPPPAGVALKSKQPRLYCKSAVLYDNKTSQKLYGRHEYDVRPIASITKLLSALTLLDFNVNWNDTMLMTREDARNSSRSRLRAGDKYLVKDLFHASMMCSDNRATRTLARSTGLTIDSFVVIMNKKADELGLLTMNVEEPTGLSEKNVASAEDCARLINIATSNPTLKKVMRRRVYRFKSLKRKRNHQIVNTNRLLKSRWYVYGGKTGYIYESGWCLTAKVSDYNGNDLTVVVLGASSKSSRFTQASKLLRWAFKELEKLEG